MIKPKLIAIIGVGLIAGFIGRGVYQQTHRVDAMIAHFDRVCRSAYEGSFVSANAKDAYLGAADAEVIWDASSKSFAEFSKWKCAVYDSPDLLNEREQKQLERAFATYIATHFPQLTLDPKSQMESFSLFRFWAQYELGDPNRWGIFLDRIETASNPTEEEWALNRTNLRIAFRHLN